MDEPQNPQTNCFRVSWLSTYDCEHPSFQKVRSSSLKTSPYFFIQIFVEYGQTSLIRAECVLVTGVRLSRMTEPKDNQEWWILSDKMKKRIDACRISWQGNDSYVPLALKPLKHRKRAVKHVGDQIPSVPEPVSEVCRILMIYLFFLTLLFFNSQLLVDKMSMVPTIQLYNLARAHVARGLTAGGIRLLWDQFPTGSFIPLPYQAFRDVFRHGWKTYNPFNVTHLGQQTLNNRHATPRVLPSLSYEYSEANNVRLSHI